MPLQAQKKSKKCPLNLLVFTVLIYAQSTFQVKIYTIGLDLSL